MTLRAQYASPGGALTAASGAVLAMTVLGSAAWCVSRELFTAAAARRVHRGLLRLTARPYDGPTPEQRTPWSCSTTASRPTACRVEAAASS